MIRLLNENESVKNISEKTGVTRMTIYNIRGTANETEILHVKH
ncbi:hypothetical protein [Peribacillus butanolivorans]